MPTAAASEAAARRLAAPVTQWTVDTVAKWLHDVVAFPNSEVEKFRAQRVDGATLMGLNEDELKTDIGITVVGDRKKILRERSLTSGALAASGASAEEMIPENSLKFEKLLGEGFFGQVHLALWHGASRVVVIVVVVGHI